MRWTPDELASDAQGRLLRRGHRPIATAFIDSRSPRRDGLFVPIVAARDGHAFVGDAVAGGASAVLIGRGREVPSGDLTVVEVDDTLEALTRLAAARRRRFAGPVVSVSGSNGKTTTRAMVAAVLGSAVDPVLCTQGNLNNHLGVPLTLLDAPHEAAAMVIELGMSAPGENDHLASIVRPDVHVITSVALEHLEFMHTLEAIAAAEAEPIAWVQPGGAVVVPSDEPLLRPHLPGPDGPRVLRFGPDEDADVRIVGVEQDVTTRAVLHVDGQEHALSLRLFGAHNARNAAAALAVGSALGLARAPMLAALERVTPVGDRGRVLELGPHVLVADCYNANPGSVAAALESLASLRARRSGPLVAVLGDMLELGPTELELHTEVGQLAAKLGLDAVAAFGPRARAIAEAASDGGIEARSFDDDLDALARWLTDRFRDADAGAVLVKGSRGMRLERLVDRLTSAG